MNVRYISGIGCTRKVKRVGCCVDYTTEPGIGALVNTSRYVNKAVHTGAEVAFFPAREAFKLLVANNVWGLANFIYDGYTALGPSELEKWKIGWYNLGGNWGKLAEKISKGYGKKATLMKIAPRNIKERYQGMGYKINGVQVKRIGAVTLAATAITAGTILAALKPLLDAAVKFAPQNKIAVPEETTPGTYDPIVLPSIPGTTPAPETGDFKKYAIPVGLGILALVLLRKK